jgi:hypothetical protein
MAANLKKLTIAPSTQLAPQSQVFDVIYNGALKRTWYPKYGNLYAYRSHDGMRLFQRFGRPGQSKYDFDLMFAEFANDERGEAVVDTAKLAEKTCWLLQEGVI